MSALEIGVAKHCISPPKPELLKPTGMGRQRPTGGVLDDLFAEALVINVDGESAFLCTVDIRYFPHPWVVRIREAVAEKINPAQ